MYIITKCTLGYITIWNLFSLGKLHNEMHNEVHNVLNSKIYWKVEFSLCFGLVEKGKNKVFILNWVFKLLLELFH